MTSSEMTPADIAAVTRNNNNGGFFGDGNGLWFIIILFLFTAIGGWGGNWGGNAGGQGVMNGYVLSSDFSNIQRQLSDSFASQERRTDAIINGISSLGYDQLGQMNNINQNVSSVGFGLQNAIQQSGFDTRNAIQQGGFDTRNAIQQGGYETRNAIQQGQIAQMQSFNALQSQLAQCCCDNRAATSELKYTIAQTGNDISRQTERGFCDTGYALATNTTAIVQNAHNDSDRIIAKLDAMEANRQAEKIAELQAENQGLRFGISQQNQSNTIINALKAPCPIPAYSVPNPNCCYQQTTCGCA